MRPVPGLRAQRQRPFDVRITLDECVLRKTDDELKTMGMMMFTPMANNINKIRSSFSCAYPLQVNGAVRCARMWRTATAAGEHPLQQPPSDGAETAPHVHNDDPGSPLRVQRPLVPQPLPAPDASAIRPGPSSGAEYVVVRFSATVGPRTWPRPFGWHIGWPVPIAAAGQLVRAGGPHRVPTLSVQHTGARHGGGDVLAGRRRRLQRQGFLPQRPAAAHGAADARNVCFTLQPDRVHCPPRMVAYDDEGRVVADGAPDKYACLVLTWSPVEGARKRQRTS